MIDEVAAEDAIFSCDVGTPTIWAARYSEMNGKRRTARLLQPWLHGQRHAAGHWSAQLDFPVAK